MASKAETMEASTRDVSANEVAPAKKSFGEWLVDCFPSQADLCKLTWWKKKIIKHFLPLGIAIALIWGLAW